MIDRLVEFFISFVDLFRFWIVLEPYEKGVLLRLGAFVRVVEPGFHWIIPLGVDHVIHENVCMRTQSLGDLGTTTKDGKQIGYHGIVTYRISDITKAMLEVEDAQDSVKDSCSGTIGAFLTGCTWEQILTDPETMDRMSAACRKKGWRWGIEIINVQLAGVSSVRTIRLMNSGIVQQHKAIT